MKKLVSGLSVALLILGMSGMARATLLYDQDVTPGVNYGSGNANGSWTIHQNNGIEVGLRTHQRGDSSGDNPANVFSSNGDGTYSWQAGSFSKTYSGVNTYNMAYWNYDFSIDLNYLGETNPTYNFSNTKVVLGIDQNPGAAANLLNIDPITLFTDNYTNSTETVAQNSENIAFGYPPGDTQADITPATWDFVLSVYNNTGDDLLAQTRMTVLIDGGASPVPEPSTLFLLSLGLGGLAITRFRMKKA